MVYVTGDTHGSIDIKKLTTKEFPQQKSMTKDDFLIICGDFGCVWDDSKDDLYWRKWFNDKPFTTLFVDGNHENHKLLAMFPVVERFGGKVHQIKPSVFHLMRGEIYNIDGAKIFCLGGASSHDKWCRTQDVSWWEEEIPSKAEFDHAVDSLEKANWSVDYIITHCAPKGVQQRLATWYENDPVTSLLQLIDENTKFKHWYFGHYHVDVTVDKRHTALYQKVIPIGEVLR